MKTAFRSVLFSILLLAIAAAYAATATTTFQVTATVSAGCTISATNHDFGIYTPSLLADNTNGTNVVTATCTLGVPYSIGLDAGIGTGATVASRKMTRVGGTETLNYSLYRTVDRLVVVGNTLSVDVISGLGTGLAIDHTMFGKIPAGQNVPVGNYVDTVTATITF
ncbi:MAG: spore coat protein U domain-containing protein [Betaproteobacteria bacterium]|nr:spore coat protein U domain-containing protein [Betaproteobacteria bacterium]